MVGAEDDGGEGVTNVVAPLTATPVLGGGVTNEGTGVDGTEPEGDEA